MNCPICNNSDYDGNCLELPDESTINILDNEYKYIISLPPMTDREFEYTLSLFRDWYEAKDQFLIMRGVGDKLKIYKLGKHNEE